MLCEYTQEPEYILLAPSKESTQLRMQNLLLEYSVVPRKVVFNDLETAAMAEDVLKTFKAMSKSEAPPIHTLKEINGVLDIFSARVAQNLERTLKVEFMKNEKL
jgi:hypothetical protein